MEKPIYPSKYMRITQSYGVGTHASSYAIDDAGSDRGIDNIIAPFTGTIKKIYKTDANEVWLESNSPVEYPDGTVDYMTILFAHDNDVSNLYVGKVISRGEVFYQEGTEGNTTGNHCHIECAKGQFSGSGWFQNASGYWSINNGKKPEECLWIDDSIVILDSKGLTFRRIPTGTPVPMPEVPTQLKYKIGDTVVINGQLFGDSNGGNPGITVSNRTTTITRAISGKPYPYNTTGDLGWISEASITLVVPEIPTPNPDPDPEPKPETPPEAQPDLEEPKLIFTCEQTDIYAISLESGQKLYLK